MTANELREFIFAKENSYYSMKHQNKNDLRLFATKLTEKVPDPTNTKEYYNSYLKRKNTKLVKQ